MCGLKKFSCGLNEKISAETLQRFGGNVAAFPRKSCSVSAEIFSLSPHEIFLSPHKNFLSPHKKLFSACGPLSYRFGTSFCRFLVCLADVRFLGKKNPQPWWLGLRIGKSLVVSEWCDVSGVMSFRGLADSNETNSVFVTVTPKKQ